MKRNHIRSFSSLTLAITLALLLLAACISSSFQKDRFMNSFRKFMVKTEKHAHEYSHDDWEKSDSVFTVFVDIEYPIYRDLLTEEERTEIHEFMGKYVGLSLKYRGNHIMETIIEGIRGTRDIIRGIKEGFIEDSVEEDPDDF